MFLLDTDHITLYLLRSGPEYDRLRQRLTEHLDSPFYVSIVSFHEQVLGWNTYISRAGSQEGVVRGYSMYGQILKDYSRMQVLPFEARAASVFEALRTRRIRVPTMDLRIAATAIAHGFNLLSRDLGHFRQVPALDVEDWTLP